MLAGQTTVALMACQIAVADVSMEAYLVTVAAAAGTTCLTNDVKVVAP